MLKKKNIMNSTIICALPTQKNILFMAWIGWDVCDGIHVYHIPMFGICFLYSHKNTHHISLYARYLILAIWRKENNVIFWWIYNNNFLSLNNTCSQCSALSELHFLLHYYSNPFTFKRPFVLFHFCIPF